MTPCLVALSLVLTLGGGPQAGAEARAAVDERSGWSAAIGQLGSLDHTTRMNAARAIRRAPESEATAALVSAVRGSADQFVRYRALVLLTAFGQRRVADLVPTLVTDRNDRIREIVYRWMAVHPDPQRAPALLAALQSEQAEFVRPALVRALAAIGDDASVRRALLSELGRGQDFFRLGVIDALGEFRATYAREALVALAKIDGPLQDDAVLALGRIGDSRSREAIEAVRVSSPDAAPAAEAALCLLAAECATREAALAAAITVSAKPERVRLAVTGLAVLGAATSDTAIDRLAELMKVSRTHDMAVVGLGGVALRSPARFLAWLAHQSSEQQDAVTAGLRSAFENFEEDFAEEQFFAEARAAYWRAADGSADRVLMAGLIQALEF